MRRLLLAAVVALSLPGTAAAQERDFTYDPFAARAEGRVSVAFTFRDAARGVRVTFAGRTSRVERVPDTRTSVHGGRRRQPGAARRPAPTGPR